VGGHGITADLLVFLAAAAPPAATQDPEPGDQDNEKARGARKTLTNCAPQPFEFMPRTLGIEYHPDSPGETICPQAARLLGALKGIPLTYRASDGAFERRNWANLHDRFTLRPCNLFTVTAGGEYNPLTHAEEVREVGVNVTPIEAFTFTVSQERVKGVTGAFTLGTTWALTPMWTVSVFGQYDFRAGASLSRNWSWRVTFTNSRSGESSSGTSPAARTASWSPSSRGSWARRASAGAICTGRANRSRSRPTAEPSVILEGDRAQSPLRPRSGFFSAVSVGSVPIHGVSSRTSDRPREDGTTDVNDSRLKPVACNRRRSGDPSH
jgi:hypothetical protein